MTTCDAMCHNEYLFIAYLLFFPKNYAGAHIRDMLTLAEPTLTAEARKLKFEWQIGLEGHLRQPIPLNWFWWNLAWLTASGTPPHTTTLVEVAQRGWSAHIINVTCNISEFLFFFSIFYSYLQRAPRSHFLTDRHNLYAKTRVFGQGCAI